MGRVQAQARCSQGEQSKTWHNDQDVDSIYSFNKYLPSAGHITKLSVRWQRACPDELGQALSVMEMLSVQQRTDKETSHYNPTC